MEAHIGEEQGVSSFLVIQFLKVMLGKNLVSQIETLNPQSHNDEEEPDFFIMMVIIGIKRIIRMVGDDMDDCEGDMDDRLDSRIPAQ